MAQPEFLAPGLGALAGATAGHALNPALQTGLGRAVTGLTNWGLGGEGPLRTLALRLGKKLYGTSTPGKVLGFAAPMGLSALGVLLGSELMKKKPPTPKAAAYMIGARLGMLKRAAADEDINKRHLDVLRLALFSPIGMGAGFVGGSLAGEKLAPLLSKGLGGLGKLITRAGRRDLSLPLLVGGGVLGGLVGGLAPLRK